MKKLLFLVLLVLAPALHAQQQATYSNPAGGNLNASSTNCSAVLSCVWQKLPSTAATSTVTITGTFTATLVVETSADGGNTFSTSSTQSAPIVLTLSTGALTDVRVRASAYTSGSAVVNIQTAGNQINVNIAAGGSNQQVQYNNNGALAGASGLTTDGTSVAFNGNASITSTPPFAAAALIGWKYCMNATGVCTGVASGFTEAHKAIWVSVFPSTAANNSTTSVPDSNASSSMGTAGFFGITYNTNTNCSVNSASPAACVSAAAGSFVVPTTTATYTVNSTAVKAASRIFLSPHTDARDLPSAPTCTAVASGFVGVSAIVAATSFTFALPSTTGQTCWDYWIVN